MSERIIFHIDVNNAFLSWTALEMMKNGYNFDIREVPSVVGGDESKRHGVVLAKSTPAKKLGIVTGESLYSARKKCHNLLIVSPNHKAYKIYSNKLFDYLKNYTPDIEVCSIDECFLDLSGTHLLYPDYMDLAYKIKDEIKDLFGFTVNVGIANNKLCAKMASDLEKPDKVNTIFRDEIETKMWPLPISDLYMVGKKSAKTLKDMGINTIGELANTNINTLEMRFKKYGHLIYEYANGIDDSKVEKYVPANKGFSISTTLSHDYETIEELKKVLYDLSEEIGIRLRNEKYYAHTIGVNLRNNAFQNYSAQNTVQNPINTGLDIYKESVKILDSCWKRDPIRLIGIRLTNLTSSNDIQLSFFDKEDKRKKNDIQNTIDNINKKFGKNILKNAGLIDRKNE